MESFSVSKSLNTSIVVFVALLVVSYVLINYFSSKESMSLLRYRPLMSGNSAYIDYDDNLAGIPDPNSHQELPNVNQYANDLAFNPNNPNSANYLMDGSSVLNPPAYQYLGSHDVDINGHN